MLMKSQSLVRNSLVFETSYAFAGLFNKRKPTKKDLDHYDVVIIGCNMGGILSRQFDKVTHGKYKTMVVLDQGVNQMTAIRNIYEQQKCAKTDYIIPAKLSLNMYTAHSDNVGCEAINPAENSVVLKNGRKIGYDHLVVAMGMQEDHNSIKGFEPAWQDLTHPVFANKDHPSWRSIQHKYTRWHYNYYHGDAFFCIPQYPFPGEVEAYNFFLSQKVWEWQEAHGRLSPIRSFTVVNANGTLCINFTDQIGDNFFKEELKKRNVKVEYGLKLVEINKDTQEAVFEDVKTGSRETRKYNHLYSVMPSKPHDSLVKAGLTTESGLLDVDIKTMRHNKYKNIFGLGDVVDVPTTKGTWAAFHQLAVVRTNLDRSLQGQSLIANYDGYSKIPIMLGQNTLTFLCHKYNNENAWHNLYFNQGGFLASLRYSNWCRNFKKAFLDFYLEKSWGPPYYKIKKSYKAPPGEGDHGDHGLLSKLMGSKKHA